MSYLTDTFRNVYPSDRSLVEKIFTPLWDLRTYLRGVHMLLMFPLGIAYFVFFVTTMSVGGSLIWTFVGPVILLATLFISRWLGDFETKSVAFVSDVEIRRPPYELEEVRGFRQQIWVRLIDPTTWTGLFYLIAQFPIGIAAFVIVITIYSIVGAMVVSPLIVLMSDDSINVVWETGQKWVIDSPVEALPLVPLGVIGFVIAAHVISTLSAAHAAWARLMLGSRSKRVSRSVTPESGDTPPPPGPGTSAQADEPIVATNESTQLEEPNTSEEDKLAQEYIARAEPFLKPVPNPHEVEADTPAAESELLKELTVREREVFMLMAHGYTNADIAEEFYISEGTVKTHVKRVLAKMEIRDRTQVVVYAYENRLVVPGESETDISKADSVRFG